MPVRGPLNRSGPDEPGVGHRLSPAPAGAVPDRPAGTLGYILETSGKGVKKSRAAAPIGGISNKQEGPGSEAGPVPFGRSALRPDGLLTRDLRNSYNRARGCEQASRLFRPFRCPTGLSWVRGGEGGRQAPGRKRYRRLERRLRRRHGGLASSLAAFQAGGQSEGVVCRVFADRTPNPYLSRRIWTSDLFERTRVLYGRADGYIALEPRTGTLWEVVELWALAKARKGLDKRLVLLGTT